MLWVDIEAVQRECWPLAYSRQSADMTARKLSLRNVSLHDVPGLKSHEHCLACAMCFGKAVLIGSAHLTRTMPYGSDLKRLNVRDRLFKHEPQSVRLASHLTVTIVIFAKIVVHDSGESIT